MATRNYPDLVVLCDVDEPHAPPSMPILHISVIEDNEEGVLGGDCVYLEIATVEETHTERVHKALASVTVDRALLIAALGFTLVEVEA